MVLQWIQGVCPVVVVAIASTAFLPQTALDGVRAAQPGSDAADKLVRFVRAPDGGIQPQAMVDAKGVLHLIYSKGDPEHGDVFYVTSTDGGNSFTKPIRINSHPGSIVAIGNVRGAHLALGKQGRVHVAWMGSGQAKPTAPGDATPMLYTRLNDAGTAFEPQRNIIQESVGLDGGGSVAADGNGNVYVAWHAPAPGKKGEEARRVWLAHSADGGETFAKERAISSVETGVCGCCGMRAFCDSQGKFFVLYRSATKLTHRDAYLLFPDRMPNTFKSVKLQDWDIDHCPMTTFAFAEGGGALFAAWETKRQVYYTWRDRKSGKLVPAIAAPGDGKNRRFPALAVNSKGQALLAWTQGTDWGKGGHLAWCVFGKDGRPTDESGKAGPVPAWSVISAVALQDGSFRIIH